MAELTLKSNALRLESQGGLMLSGGSPLRGHPRTPAQSPGQAVPLLAFLRGFPAARTPPDPRAEPRPSRASACLPPGVPRCADTPGPPRRGPAKPCLCLPSSGGSPLRGHPRDPRTEARPSRASACLPPGVPRCANTPGPPRRGPAKPCLCLPSSGGSPLREHPRTPAQRPGQAVPLLAFLRGFPAARTPPGPRAEARPSRASAGILC